MAHGFQEGKEAKLTSSIRILWDQMKRAPRNPQKDLYSLFLEGNDFEDWILLLGGYSSGLTPILRSLCQASSHLENESIKRKILEMGDSSQLPRAHGGKGSEGLGPDISLWAGFVEGEVDSQAI